MFIGYGEDLAASSLIYSDDRDDLKEAIERFEHAKSLSSRYYTHKNYQFALNKLKYLTGDKKYILITNDKLSLEKELVFGLYYRIPQDLQVDFKDLGEKLNLQKTGKNIKDSPIFEEGSINYEFLGTLSNSYFYSVKFSPKNVNISKQSSPNLITEILNQGMDRTFFFKDHSRLFDEIKKVYDKLHLTEKKFTIADIDLMVLKKGTSQGGFGWPMDRSKEALTPDNSKLSDVDIINYRGIPISFKDYKFMLDMEKYFWGEPIPYKIDFQEKILDFGFIAEQGHITHLYLAHKTLISPLPKSIGNLDGLLVLDICWNKLREIPKEIGNLKSLKHLNFHFNEELKELPEELFKLENLEKLEMHYNKNLHPNLERIDSLKNLKYLDINNIPLKKLPVSLRKLKNLENLNVSHCGITEVPEFIGEITSLKSLNLGVNPFKALPKSLERLTSLESLIIDKAELESVPDVIFSIKSLKRLKISNNNINRIPDSLRELENLENLEITNSKITEIPDPIGNLEKLINLNCSDNRINKISPEIGKLKNLEALDLGFNMINKFPGDILNLKNLKILKLGSNLIKIIPETIDQLAKLEELILFHNKFTEIPKAIGNLKNLKLLELEENKLSSIPDELKRLKNLEKLVLTYIKFPNPSEIREKMGFVKDLRLDD